MGRQLSSGPLTSFVVLAPLALLGACVDVAPRSSVPFQAAAEREIRYAAEATLAVKENRQGEASEAAANGRMVLPQMPEVWASLPASAARERAAEAHGRAADVDRLALFDAGESAAGASPAAAGCAGVWWDRRDADDCPGPSPGAGPELPPLFPAAIAPTGAPEAVADGIQAQGRKPGRMR